MAYNFISASVFVVFTAIVNCRFVIVEVCIFGKLSSFVIVVWKPGKGIFCNKFVGVV